ncbi:MAG: glycerol-3-phosphate dehydrogenase/oxidase [Deltaproteobacteria bacterium]|nr:glycerol-3-phosphate dehydrogenase/oxidase [Deltaproteobacteria bacterium]
MKSNQAGQAGQAGQIDEQWDLIVIGGGITGAGVFREAVRMGYKTLLVEQKDFSWGTSSRSSKMVHGGLRYMAQGKFLLTMTSVREREKLLREAPGLVEILEILIPVYSDQKPGKHTLSLGLSIYGLMALEKQHTYFNKNEFLAIVPDIKKADFVGGFQFLDAQVDDSRLVLRLINEGIASGGRADNYTEVTEIVRDAERMVSGVRVKDAETKEERIFSTRAVINATGSWAETFHPSPKPNLHLRPLRGSHLILPKDALPISRTISFLHPDDKRPVFASIWEGRILIGTTDLDHDEDLSKEPSTTREEVEYLLDGINAYFPDHKLTAEDCIATMAGVRPVLSEGKLDPSKESRENVVWSDKGLVTVTGGKLTTFRKMAFDTLKTTSPFLPKPGKKVENEPVFAEINGMSENSDAVSEVVMRRLCGRYGKAAEELIKMSSPDDLTQIPGTNTLWAEIPFTAKYENVRHLEDLLLRRVRIGLLLPEGGKEYLDKIQKLCKSILPWDEKRWEEEKKAYLKLWQEAYSVPKLN